MVFSAASEPSENLQALLDGITFYVDAFFPRGNISSRSSLVDSSVAGFPFSEYPKFNWGRSKAGRPQREGADDLEFATSRVVILKAVAARVVLPNCGRKNCAAKINIVAAKFLRRMIVTRALKRIRARPNFLNVFDTDKKKFKIVRRGKRMFSVFVPFRQSYLREVIPS